MAGTLVDVAKNRQKVIKRRCRKVRGKRIDETGPALGGLQDVLNGDETTNNRCFGGIRQGRLTKNRPLEYIYRNDLQYFDCLFCHDRLCAQGVFQVVCFGLNGCDVNAVCKGVISCHANHFVNAGFDLFN